MFTVYHYNTRSGRVPVKEFINKQNVQTRDKILEVIEYFEEYGFHLSTKYLRRMTGTKKLWELRAVSQGNQYRIFLAKIDSNTVVLLHIIIKKKQRTPRKDIQIAEKRLLEITMTQERMAT